MEPKNSKDGTWEKIYSLLVELQRTTDAEKTARWLMAKSTATKLEETNWGRAKEQHKISSAGQIRRADLPIGRMRKANSFAIRR